MRRPTLTVGRAFGLAAAGATVIAVLFLIVGGLALSRLGDARTRAVDVVAPALAAASDLRAALLDEETGVRGFLLTRDRRSLAPYTDGMAAERAATLSLEALLDRLGDPSIRSAFDTAVADAAVWRDTYATGAVAAARSDSPGSGSMRAVDAGRARFDRLRRSLETLTDQLLGAQIRGRDDLRANATTVSRVFYGSGGLLLLAILAAAFVLRRGVTAPIARLGRSVGRVADGDYETPIRAEGLADMRMLGEGVDQMRRRVVDELAAVQRVNTQLEQQRGQLERSNAELEQFAYVASHDLQEPLRKIASFGQLLQRRYKGQLDEKADQYLDFSVDGARRMQALINDLLAFSRVGRLGDQAVAVPLEQTVARAVTALGAAVEETGATVEREQLPVVLGEQGLLDLLLQNLIANAIKFRRPGVPPTVRLTSREIDGFHEICCSDNGIGIDEEYAERIFVIFQRLHTREAYDGTGIGLSLCRKIVEHHGGRIWLDSTGPGPGTTLRFTLPAYEELPET